MIIIKRKIYFFIFFMFSSTMLLANAELIGSIPSYGDLHKTFFLADNHILFWFKGNSNKSNESKMVLYNLNTQEFGFIQRDSKTEILGIYPYNKDIIYTRSTRGIARLKITKVTEDDQALLNEGFKFKTQRECTFSLNGLHISTEEDDILTYPDLDGLVIASIEYDDSGLNGLLGFDRNSLYKLAGTEDKPFIAIDGFAHTFLKYKELFNFIQKIDNNVYNISNKHYFSYKYDSTANKLVLDKFALYAKQENSSINIYFEFNNQFENYPTSYAWNYYENIKNFLRRDVLGQFGAEGTAYDRFLNFLRSHYDESQEHAFEEDFKKMMEFFSRFSKQHKKMIQELITGWPDSDESNSVDGYLKNN